jgi:hypothetical protein
MIKMTRNPGFVLFFGSLWIGSGVEAQTQTFCTINFVSNDGVSITNGSFKYLENHPVATVNSGHFKFLQSADLHALNYTFKAGATTTNEGCAGSTCNVKYDVFTNFQSIAKAYHMDVEWNSGANRFVDLIDFTTLTSLDSNLLPGCNAFKASDGTVALGTFTRTLNGVTGSPIAIKVTTTSCFTTVTQPATTYPPPPVVTCPVYATPAQHGCCLTALFARHPFRLCRR